MAAPTLALDDAAALDAQTFAGTPEDIWFVTMSGRLGLQSDIVWSGLNDGYRDAGVIDPASPYATIYWQLGSVKTQHCDNCRSYAAGSPYDPPGSGGNVLNATPGDGHTQCGAGCHCSLVYGLSLPGADPRLSAFNTPGGPPAPPGLKWPNVQEATATGTAEELDAQQQAALDEYRAGAERWEQVKNDLPSLPTLLGAVEGTPGTWVEWEDLTRLQREVLRSVYGAMSDFLRAYEAQNGPITPEEALQGVKASAEQLDALQARIQARISAIEKAYAEVERLSYEEQMRILSRRGIPLLLWYLKEDLDMYAYWMYLGRTGGTLADLEAIKADQAAGLTYPNTLSEPGSSEHIQLDDPGSHPRDKRGRWVYNGGRHRYEAEDQHGGVLRVTPESGGTFAIHHRQVTGAPDHHEAGATLARVHEYATQHGIEGTREHLTPERVAYDAAHAHEPATHAAYRAEVEAAGRATAARSQRAIAAVADAYRAQQAADVAVRTEMRATSAHSPQAQAAAEQVSRANAAEARALDAYNRALDAVAASPHDAARQMARDAAQRAYGDAVNATRAAQHAQVRAEEPRAEDVARHPAMVAAQAQVLTAQHLQDTADRAVGAQHEREQELRQDTLAAHGLPRVQIELGAGADAVARAYFGQRDDEAYAHLVRMSGARAGETVHINQYGGKLALRVHDPAVTGPTDRVSMEFARNAQGEIVAHVGWVTSRSVGRGKDTESGVELLRGITAMRDAHVAEVRAAAAGHAGGSMNGYNIWPKLGAEGRLDYAQQHAASAHFNQHITHVEQLMDTSEGRAWWREHGDGVDIVMNLRPGGQTRKVVDDLEARYRNRPGRDPNAALSEWLGETYQFTTDAHGHEHAPSGPGGGRFISTGGAHGEHEDEHGQRLPFSRAEFAALPKRSEHGPAFANHSMFATLHGQRYLVKWPHAEDTLSDHARGMRNEGAVVRGMQALGLGHLVPHAAYHLQGTDGTHYGVITHEAGEAPRHLAQMFGRGKRIGGALPLDQLQSSYLGSYLFGLRDRHHGNVLYDQDKHTLRLIDFGESFHPSAHPHLSERDAVLDLWGGHLAKHGDGAGGRTRQFTAEQVRDAVARAPHVLAALAPFHLSREETQGITERFHVLRTFLHEHEAYGAPLSVQQLAETAARLYPKEHQP